MRNAICRSLAVVAIGLGWVSTPLSSDAATTNYGTFVGTSVIYANVGEGSVTDPLPLFGTPTIAGNTLDFNPVGFGAFSTGPANAFTDGQLDLTIIATAGNIIPNIVFSERGDFSLLGLGSAATYVDVSATFFIDVVEVDGISINPLSTTASMTFAPVANGTMTLPGFPGSGQFWSGSLNFNVNAFLLANSVSFVNGATEIKVTLDNTLAAYSENGTTAFIAKKDFKGLGITVPEVPEPSTLTLLLAGAGLLALRSRRVG